MVCCCHKKNCFNAGLKQFHRNGGLLLDVRDCREYRKGHLAGAINIPLSEIGRMLCRFPNRCLPIYVYCKSGQRSGAAAAYLRRHGYHNVTDLGGICDR